MKHNPDREISGLPLYHQGSINATETSPDLPGSSFFYLLCNATKIKNTHQGVSNDIFRKSLRLYVAFAQIYNHVILRAWLHFNARWIVRGKKKRLKIIWGFLITPLYWMDRQNQWMNERNVWWAWGSPYPPCPPPPYAVGLSEHTSLFFLYQ